MVVATNLLALLLVVLVGEAAVRLFRLAPLTLTVFKPHPARMFALAPEQDQLFVGRDFATRVIIGPDGFRVPAGAPRAGAGGPRVLALGDSMTFGYGVEAEESWPEVLETLLRKDDRPDVEVINAGVVAYAPDQQLDQLRELLPRVRPDVVVLGLYPGNDLAEVMLHSSAPPITVSPEGALLTMATEADLHPNPVGLWLTRHLRLYSYMRVKVHRTLTSFGLTEKPVLYHPAYFADALGYTDAYEENWEKLEGLLAAIDVETKAAGGAAASRRYSHGCPGFREVLALPSGSRFHARPGYAARGPPPIAASSLCGGSRRSDARFTPRFSRPYRRAPLL